MSHGPSFEDQLLNRPTPLAPGVLGPGTAGPGAAFVTPGLQTRRRGASLFWWINVTFQVLGAIAGVPWLGAIVGCHCWVPLLPLGAMAGSHGRVALVGCHCWVPLLGAIAGVPLLVPLLGATTGVPLIGVAVLIYRTGGGVARQRAHCYRLVLGVAL